jgi:hypothetical protein
MGPLPGNQPGVEDSELRRWAARLGGAAGEGQDRRVAARARFVWSQEERGECERELSWVLLCALCIRESLDGCSVDGSDRGWVEMNRHLDINFRFYFMVRDQSLSLVDRYMSLLGLGREIET